MWKHQTSWIEVLDGLPGLNLYEKSRARVIILSKPSEDRELYIQGTYAEVTSTIKALLRETPVGDLNSSPDANALHLAFLKEAAVDENLASARSSSTDISSSCTSHRPSPRELLVETASAIRHLGTLPAAFRTAHFRASQPGDIYFYTVKDLLPTSTNPDCSSVSVPKFERGRVKFAMVVSASSLTSSPPSTSMSSSASSSSSSSSSSCKGGPDPDAIIAVRIRSIEVSRKQPGKSAWPLTEYEAEVVPDPSDNLEAVLERLDRREVQPDEVLWWRKSAGQWALWNGTPQRSWCMAISS